MGTESIGNPKCTEFTIAIERIELRDGPSDQYVDGEQGEAKGHRDPHSDILNASVKHENSLIPVCLAIWASGVIAEYIPFLLSHVHGEAACVSKLCTVSARVEQWVIKVVIFSAHAAFDDVMVICHVENKVFFVVVLFRRKNTPKKNDGQEEEQVDMGGEETIAGSEAFVAAARSTRQPTLVVELHQKESPAASSRFSQDEA